jgi:adenylate cyclase
LGILALRVAAWRVEVVPLLLSGVLIYGVAFAVRWRWMRQMLGMFKSESVARALEADPSKLDLKGELREITVLFCDIRNFTRFSENRPAAEVVRLLNRYFAVVVPIVEKHGGILNQYIGDGLMVLFGAPETQHDHARRAVAAAVEIVECVTALADQWRRLGADEFRIGVGVHTGKAVVGTIGSPQRIDYTAIGDTVNTASRIESCNKELGTEILLSAATVDALADDERRRVLSRSRRHALSVKGKTGQLEAYSVERSTGEDERAPREGAEKPSSV